MHRKKFRYNVVAMKHSPTGSEPGELTIDSYCSEDSAYERSGGDTKMAVANAACATATIAAKQRKKEETYDPVSCSLVGVVGEIPDPE